MNKRKLNRIWLAGMALLLASVACVGGKNTPQPVTPPSNLDPASIRQNLIASTVQIYGLFDRNGKLVPGYVGSGTLISSDGLILTNAHVADPTAVGDPESHPDALAVGMVSFEDKPAVFAYRAEVVAIDGYLDLAVIRIVSALDGSAINSSDLHLPYVPLGDSDQVHVGDHINIYGFPAIGGETITYTDGNISGFTAEDQVGDRAWIKTDATISGGNSGGLAGRERCRLYHRRAVAGLVRRGRRYHRLPRGAGYQWRRCVGQPGYLHPDWRLYQCPASHQPGAPAVQFRAGWHGLQQSLWRDDWNRSGERE
jgi:hypothetical protein